MVALPSLGSGLSRVVRARIGNWRLAFGSAMHRGPSGSGLGQSMGQHSAFRASLADSYMYRVLSLRRGRLDDAMSATPLTGGLFARGCVAVRREADAVDEEMDERCWRKFWLGWVTSQTLGRQP